MNLHTQNLSTQNPTSLVAFYFCIRTSYWNIGRIIIEHEQKSKERAEYGTQTLKELSKTLTAEFGKGFSVSNIQFMRRFYQVYQIQQTASVKLSWSHYCELLSISDEQARLLRKRNYQFQVVCTGNGTDRKTKILISNDKPGAGASPKTE
jgi:hypothetical protein